MLVRQPCGSNVRAVVARLFDMMPVKAIAVCLTAIIGTTAAAQQVPAPVQLQEAPPWLTNPLSGPAKAKGVIYFLRGGNKFGPFDGFDAAPYFLKTFSDSGWDVIQAKFSHEVFKRAADGSDVRSLFMGAGRYTVQRLNQLRAQGYRRVVLAGHGTGSFLAMAVVRTGFASPDVLLLHSPTRFGQKTLPSGRPNPSYPQNFTLFRELISSVKVPTILITFSDPIGLSLNGIGKIALEHLTHNNVPHLIIDKPAGFSGHHAGWLPYFDQRYQNCVHNFLDRATTESCAVNAASDTDFRSIFYITQIPDAYNKRVVSGETLRGRRFLIYPQGKPILSVDHPTATERINFQFDENFREEISFHAGLLCVAKTCTQLVQFSEGHILEFDPRTGGLTAWWIER